MSRNRKNRKRRNTRPVRLTEITEKPPENERKPAEDVRKPAEDVRKPVEVVQQHMESTQEQLQKSSLMSSTFLQVSFEASLLSQEGKKAAFECMSLILQAITGIEDIALESVESLIDPPAFHGHPVEFDVVARDSLGRLFLLKAENRVSLAGLDMMIWTNVLMSAITDRWEGEELVLSEIRLIIVTPEKVPECRYEDGRAGVEVVYHNPMTDKDLDDIWYQYFWSYTGYANEEGGNPLLADIMHDFTVVDPEECRLDCFRQLLQCGKGDKGYGVLATKKFRDAVKQAKG